MKRSIVGLFFMFVPLGGFSHQPDTISGIVAFVATNDYRTCFGLTNDIDRVMSATTGVLERSTCKLVKASILFDHSVNMVCEDSFACATNLCREIEADLAGRTAWQRVAALCKFTNAMIEDGHPEVAFNSSTNLLTEFQGVECPASDTNVWNVLFKPGGLDAMPLLGFIKASAAAAQHEMDPCADLTFYTNGIPQEVIREIIEK